MKRIFALVPIDKVANNTTIISKRYYVEALLKDAGIMGEESKT